MSLFSSKSSSNTQINNETQQVSGTVGDLSSGNMVIGGDFQQVGLSDNVSEMLLQYSSDASKRANETLSQAFNLTQSAGQTVKEAYDSAYNETSATLKSLAPLILGGLGILALGYILKGKGGKIW